MGLKVIDKIKNENWYLMVVVFTCAALAPEYIAPFFTAVGAIFTLKNTNLEVLKFNSFSIGYTFFLFYGWMIVGLSYANSIISGLATLGLWLLMFLGFWLCNTWIDSKEKLDKVILGGSIAAGINGGIGVLQALLRAIVGPKAATLFNPFWHFIDLIFEKIVYILPDFFVKKLPRTTFTVFPTRSSGTFSNPLFYATFLVAMLSLCFYCFLNGKDHKTRKIGLACIVLSLAGIATSFSRGPYIVTVAVFVMLLIYGGVRAKKVMLIGAVSGVSVLIIFSKVILRILTLGSSDDSSINTRKAIFKAVFEKIPEEFMFGYGTGFDSVRSILHNEYNIKRAHAHNILLEFHMENGFIGVLLFLLICLVMVFNLYRLYKKGGAARNFGITFFASFIAMCMCGMTDCFFYGLKPMQYFMMILGLAQASVNIFLKNDDFFDDLKMLFGDIKDKIKSLKKLKNNEYVEELIEENEEIRV